MSEGDEEFDSRVEHCEKGEGGGVEDQCGLCGGCGEEGVVCCVLGEGGVDFVVEGLGVGLGVSCE